MKTIAFVVIAGGLAMWTASHSTLRSENFEKTIEVQPGGTLHLDLDLGEVQIESHDEDTVRIETRVGGWPWTAEFEVEENARDVRLAGRAATADGMVAQAARWALWPFQLLHVDVEVRVPRDYSVDAETDGGSIRVSRVTGNTTLRTGGGRIDLEGIGGDVDAWTGGGRIYVEAVEGTVRAVSGGGRVRIEEVSGTVEVKSGGGRVYVSDVDGEVRAKTAGGRMYTHFNGVPSGAIETGGGRIEVRIPEEAGVDLRVSTGGGRIRVDDDLDFVGRRTPLALEGQINGGGPALDVRTSGGRIEIESS